MTRQQATSQSVILPEPRSQARFLVLRNEGGEAAPVLRAAAAVPQLCSEIAAIAPEAGLVCGVGFGRECWDRIAESRPRALRPFRAIEQQGRVAVNTGGDVLIHIVSDRADLNAELMLRALSLFGDDVTVLEDVQGFVYLDNRDLTGFIDGTENPSGPGRADAALIGDEDPLFVAGSYVFTQRYVHDLSRWQKLSVTDQEGIIGRRRADSEELPDELRPATAHISRVVIEEDGEELEILRHSFPYATATEAGLFFIAYTRDLAIPEKMLARMLGTDGDGHHDHLMDYSRAVSGATFFVPAVELLERLASEKKPSL